MPKKSKSKPTPATPIVVGKGSITPLQIAFIVHNYLSLNNFTATLSAFRSEASHLLSKTSNHIEVPKGLLGLAEILEDYVSLKEQKLFVDRERRRVELALLGMQEVIDNYRASASPNIDIELLAPPTRPPPHLTSSSPEATKVAPAAAVTCCPPPQSSNLSPADDVSNVASSLLTVKTPIALPHMPADGSISGTPENNSSCTKKRKILDCTPNVPLAPKKQRSTATPKSTKIGDIPSKATSVTRNDDNVKPPVTDSKSNDVESKSVLEDSYVAESLFKRPSHCLINDTCMLTNVGSSSSVIASVTLVASPAKHPGYYKNFNLTSPSKVPNSGNKREHVRGKLDFYNVVTPANEGLVAKSSNLSGPVDMSDEFDLPELDFLSGDISFSEFLADIDLDNKEDPAEQLPHSNSSERCNINGHPETNNFVSYSSVSIEKKISGGITIQGDDTVTSVRSFTKRIKLVNPARPKPSLHSQQFSTEADESRGNN